MNYEHEIGDLVESTDWVFGEHDTEEYKDTGIILEKVGRDHYRIYWLRRKKSSIDWSAEFKTLVSSRDENDKEI